MFISLDPQSKEPLYRQIAEAVERELADGRLQPGDKLPTVRELAQELSAAQGTIKRAYDELHHRGIIEMAQGRGTFIAEREQPDSRKERAMQAIDGLLDCLEELSFSPREMQIFLELKLRERVQRGGRLRLALVDCCPEGLFQLSDRLYGLRDADVYPLPLEDALAYPYRLTDDMDLVVTTEAHYEKLRPLVPERGRLARLCIRPTDGTLTALARLPRGARLGLLAVSRPYGEMLRRVCAAACPEADIQGLALFGAERPQALLARCDAAVIPLGFEQLCAREEQEAIELFARSHPLIRAAIEPDQGSMRTLEALAGARRRSGKSAD